MTFIGKRDDDAEKERLEKEAQIEASEQKRGRGRPRKDFTEVIAERAEDRIPKLTDKALDALERGVNSNNEKLAVDAASKFFKIFHNPTQKVDVQGNDKSDLHIHMSPQNNISEKEKALLGEVLDLLKQGPEPDSLLDEDIIDVTPIEPKEITDGSE